MSWRLLGLLAIVAAAALVGLAVGRMWLLSDGDQGAGGARPSAILSATADVQPRVHAFADPVLAQVTVLVDRTFVDPESLRIEPRFDPYEPTGPIRQEVTESGASGRVVFSIPLICLREGCEPTESAQVLNIRSGHVLYRYRNDGRAGQADYSFGWPTVEVIGRVAAPEVEQRRWRADLTTLPAVSWRIEPGALAAGLLAGSLALALLAALGAWGLVAPRREPAAALVEVERSPLERALELARSASRNGDAPQRRKALERVARELGTLDLGELAEHARRLAWSPSDATSSDVDALAREVGAEAKGEPS